MDDSFICSLCSYHLPLEKYTLLVLLSFNSASLTPLSLYPVPPLGTLMKMTQTWDFWDAGGLHKHNLLVSSDLK